MLIISCFKSKVRHEPLSYAQSISIEGFGADLAYRWMAIGHKFHIKT